MFVDWDDGQKLYNKSGRSKGESRLHEEIIKQSIRFMNSKLIAYSSLAAFFVAGCGNRDGQQRNSSTTENNLLLMLGNISQPATCHVAEKFTVQDALNASRGKLQLDKDLQKFPDVATYNVIGSKSKLILKAKWGSTLLEWKSGAALSFSTTG